MGSIILDKMPTESLEINANAKVQFLYAYITVKQPPNLSSTIRIQ